MKTTLFWIAVGMFLAAMTLAALQMTNSPEPPGTVRQSGDCAPEILMLSQAIEAREDSRFAWTLAYACVFPGEPLPKYREDREEYYRKHWEGSEDSDA